MSRLVPYMPSNIKNVRSVFKEMGLNSEDIFYDLGCGDGRIISLAVNEFNVKKAVGIEIRPNLIDPAVYEKNNIEIRIEDLNGSDFTDATVIYTYLTDVYMLRLRRKLSLLKGVTIVSCWFPVEGWIPDDVFKFRNDMFYIYRIGGQK